MLRCRLLPAAFCCVAVPRPAPSRLQRRAGRRPRPAPAAAPPTRPRDHGTGAAAPIRKAADAQRSASAQFNLAVMLLDGRRRAGRSGNRAGLAAQGGRQRHAARAVRARRCCTTGASTSCESPPRPRPGFARRRSRAGATRR
ncbi:MAG: hypothetical protein MZW92_44590 [Comamonadaceae bacterium]|nr:hypothetical protein [Comamonadaceae bacterium]